MEYSKMKVLIIEDDAGLNRGISFALNQEGYETMSARTLREGCQLFGQKKPGAVILDLNLPDGDGMEFCRKVRALPGAEAGTVSVMLTARDLETDEIMGLTSGADDYITKPFSVSVLKLRLLNILNRKEIINGGSDQRLVSGEVALDVKRFRAFLGGQELELGKTEFRLLQYLMEHKNQVLLKEQILQRIWDGDYVEENTLSVNISRLRKKLGRDHIRTVPGIGYLWEEHV